MSQDIIMQLKVSIKNLKEKVEKLTIDRNTIQSEINSKLNSITDFHNHLKEKIKDDNLMMEMQKIETVINDLSKILIE